jgi:hypothetical protein
VETWGFYESNADDADLPIVKFNRNGVRAPVEGTNPRPRPWIMDADGHIQVKQKA